MSRFRVASYNVHSCIGIDRRFAPDRIAEAVGQIDADVIALQELGWHHRGLRNFDQFCYLEERTGYRVIEGPTKFHARAHYGNAILVREPVETYRTIDLSWPLHIPRGGVLATIRLGDMPVTVVNVHLGLTPWERRRQVRMLVTEIDRLDGPVILMGDFNSWKPGGSMFNPLATRLPNYTERPTFHARAPRIPLDRIYLSPHLDFESIEVLKTPLTAKASDHLPVVADIVPTAYANGAALERGAAMAQALSDPSPPRNRPIG